MFSRRAAFGVHGVFLGGLGCGLCLGLGAACACGLGHGRKTECQHNSKWQ
jgi:hypothetical protein